MLDNIHCHLRCQHHHNIREQHPQVVWERNHTVWTWMLWTTRQRPAARCELPGFQENCSIFLRQTMSRRMQLVNLSLISVEGSGEKNNQSWINLFGSHRSATWFHHFVPNQQVWRQRWDYCPILVSFWCVPPLTAVWHLKQVVLFKLLEDASFNLHKLGGEKNIKIHETSFIRKKVMWVVLI